MAFDLRPTVRTADGTERAEGVQEVLRWETTRLRSELYFHRRPKAGSVSRGRC